VNIGEGVDDLVIVDRRIRPVVLPQAELLDTQAPQAVVDCSFEMVA
jgi:hypothetical protein